MVHEQVRHLVQLFSTVTGQGPADLRPVKRGNRCSGTEEIAFRWFTVQACDAGRRDERRQRPFFTCWGDSLWPFWQPSRRVCGRLIGAKSAAILLLGCGAMSSTHNRALRSRSVQSRSLSRTRQRGGRAFDRRARRRNLRPSGGADRRAGRCGLRFVSPVGLNKGFVGGCHDRRFAGPRRCQAIGLQPAGASNSSDESCWTSAPARSSVPGRP